MGQFVELTAADGHRFACYRADPAGRPRAGLVVVQEIFGVNGHIRSVADGFAADGFAVAAPAVYDRVERGIELGYTEADIVRGREIREHIPYEKVLADLTAAADAVRFAGKVGMVGYCWGASMVWMAACRGRFDAGVCYYGAQIAPIAHEKPGCPVLLHFGEQDASIPPADIAKIRGAHPGLEIHIYPAGHGFNCDHRASYHADSARLARTRTLAFFGKSLVQ